MSYSVKEIFFTIQGEGAHTGRPVVLCRFAGCNLWNGKEESRSSAVCKFCDTEFIGMDGTNGGRFQTPEDLYREIRSLWPFEDTEYAFVVFSGGEPLLQLDDALIQEMHEGGFKVAVETNGTIKAPDGIDWICVSPKANAEILQTRGNELKLVFPQLENSPTDYLNLDFDHWFIQPLDDSAREMNMKAAIEYCMNNPKWRLSLQTHKTLGIR